MMENKSRISAAVINRLPRYYRFLTDLLENGTIKISSGELSARMGLTASQIRQDLNCFGGFGQQGYGYNVRQLQGEIAAILGIDKRKKAIIIGAGNMGRTLAYHMDFENKGFNLIGIFDKNDAMTGQLVNGMPIRNISTLDEFCRENFPIVAVLCIPKNAARDIADTLVSLGIKGFWNFSHFDFGDDYPGVTIENVHLGDSLMRLCYKVHNKQ